MAGPSYLPEAIPTSLGWAHPLTGEQLDVTKGLEDAVDYYKPNAGALSFIDPEGETEFLAFAVVTGRRVKFAIHTLHPVVAVEWDMGDESDLIVGSTTAMHVFPASATDEVYEVTATVTYLAEDEELEESVEAEEVITIEVTVPATVIPASGTEGDDEGQDDTGELE